MNSTAVGETNSAVRGVITTAPEREMTDVEMNGTTGSGTEVGSVAAGGSTGIMTEAAGSDSLHLDTT